MVLNVLPPGEQSNIYNVDNYPSRNTQLEIAQLFNKALEEFCLQENIIFLSIFDKLLNSKKERIKKYIYDDVHYRKEIVPLIINQLKCKGISV